jgi:hypothetical protein
MTWVLDMAVNPGMSKVRRAKIVERINKARWVDGQSRMSLLCECRNDDELWWMCVDKVLGYLARQSNKKPRYLQSKAKKKAQTKKKAG